MDEHTTERDAPQVVMVHPDDVNLADAKALAARYDTHVVGSPYVPRGQMFLMRDPRAIPPDAGPREAHERQER